MNTCLVQVFILEHSLTLFSSQNHMLGSNSRLLSPSLNTKPPESSLLEPGVKV